VGVAVAPPSVGVAVAPVGVFAMGVATVVARRTAFATVRVGVAKGTDANQVDEQASHRHWL